MDSKLWYFVKYFFNISHIINSDYEIKSETPKISRINPYSFTHKYKYA